ncbi:Fe-S cluster assembly protein SufD [Lactobacillus johnsonii]|uniref:FeS assembly protein SufD n=1 Tax=Lactobacillus johnsonii ATCC 33200 TaxID=525330 RepID=C2E697_LACJH|nr:Fe-S cluster assembly protein SufD [Lactobacillus johnsonii]EEJ59464.1 FeS assembly protein SufD [Lactobacillus johnsonii ATCC 33200]KRK55920.1 iron-sulfur ABC superfamily ATP binding cassette transporter, membrane protein [Lactobacillus johnsonii ATCC 33200]MCF0083547.1 Fe-S cluster assembly protein SufD [Lactobacillus johnsonii]MCT3323227.1 Fe-S cluster assembly protein SufD [Lactobacillus johnsonii]MCT3380206.1 Fe-S cluster assembly protein SufD [Lactobacillus johnsonii]
MLTKENLLNFSHKNNESSWLTDLRLKAFERLEELDYPKMQRFSYQDWPLIKKEDFPWSNQADFSLKEEQKLLEKKGIILTDIFTASKKYPELVQSTFGSVIKHNEDKLTAYHYAYLNSGLFLYIPKDTILTEPITISLSPTQDTYISHLLIVADNNSKVKFLEEIQDKEKKASSASLMVELIARPGSHIEFSSLDELSQDTTLYFNRRAKIEKDAHVEWAIAFMNDCNTLGDLDSELVGEGSFADSKAIAVTTANQKVGINNRVTNRGPHSTGLINQRGVLLENSRLIFNGIGQIVHGAHGSKADQQNRVLMMSDEAHGDANPLLLIDENDVIAAHAASVGPVDKVQMNYLMSRGIPYDQAQRLVIRGFLGAVLDAIPNKDVRRKMIDILERKLIDGQIKH